MLAKKLPLSLGIAVLRGPNLIAAEGSASAAAECFAHGGWSVAVQVAVP